LGQKSHPYALRLGYIKNWKAKWFKSKGYSKQLLEDLKVRKFVKERLQASGVADIEIERSSGTIRIYIHTARPGIIIGRRGQEIDRLRDDLKSMVSEESQKIDIKIVEVKVPQIDAQLVAENVAQQLEKRVAFRKAMKKAVIMAMSKGAKGAKIIVGGRLGGSEIARSEKYMEGSLPLSTFRADIDYGFTEAMTTYGTIGIKVWIYKGDVLVKKKQAEEELMKEQTPEDLEHGSHAEESEVPQTPAR
jgi:small subunit ribosomal protein S3